MARTLRPVFNLDPGRVLAGKYEVTGFLGRGREGEVYRVVEPLTGAPRAAKLFYPERNENDRALRFYATKLEGMRGCSLVIHYHHSETVRIGPRPISMLVSEFVDGVLLRDMIRRARGKALPPLEALLITRAVAGGVAEIHASGEYHGDLHEGNILVRRRGVRFKTKVIDMQDFGRPSRANREEDICQLVRTLYEMVGGKQRYHAQPPQIKNICRGLRRDLIIRRFPTAAALCRHLDEFEWADS